MKKIYLLLFIVFILSNYIQAQKCTISGLISDIKNGETLISSAVFESNSRKGTVSNSYGFYSLTLPKGPVTLVYSYVGFAPQQLTFNLSRDTVINIRLKESVELSEVTVLGHSKDFGVHGSQMSAIDIPIIQIKAVPALFGETDVIKALLLLPGVKGGAEGSSQIYVRGGGPDENLILLDGVPVYDPNHALGFFSLFNADAIKNVTLYKGDFPARYGGRLSSVIDIRMNDGNNQRLHGNVTIGLISSKINLEGPLFNENTTFNVSARRTYLDVLAKPLILASQSNVPSSQRTNGGYYFYDLNAKLSHKFSDNDRIYLSAYLGDDVFYINTENGSTTSDDGSQNTRFNTNMNWGNIISALRWNHIINNKLFMNATADYTRYRFLLDIGTQTETKITSPPRTINESINLGFRSGIEDLSGKLDFDYAPNPNHDVKFGLNYTFHTFRPDVIVASSTSNQQAMDTTIGDQNILSHETILYAEDNISLGYAVKANIGLHYSTFFVQNQPYQSLQPRIGIRFLINDKLSLKAGFATMNQYIHLLSNSNIELPTDLWVPVTKRIKPMKSQQISAGVFYNLLEMFDLSVETYYKNMDNLIEYKDGATFFGSSTGWEDKVDVGRGWAYGIEFLAQKTVGKTTGWIGYTWSRTERLFDRTGQELNNGLAFPAKYDRTHDLSIVVSHKFSNRIDVAATWVYSTGNTATLALQNYAGTPIPDTGFQMPKSGSSYIQNLTSLPFVSARDNYRYNSYHRLDLGVNFHKQKKHGIRTWNISVYNAYNHLNPFFSTVKTNSNYNSTTGTYTETKTLTQISIFPIIPSVSYTYKF